MKWPKVSLNDIKAPSRYSFVGGPFGSNLTTRDYVDDGVPVIRGNNLPADSTFLDNDFVFVKEQKADSLTSNLAHSGDLVFTQRGTLGQVGLIPPESRFSSYVISQSQMKLTVDPDKADAKFIYFYFRSPATVQSVINHALTSGVPHINLGILKRFEVPLPPLDEQRRVAEVLTNYDGLMENNRRRMRLLEDAAQLLYREWFVRLRFPGHEHSRFIDGVPVGWERKTLEEICMPGDRIQTGPFGSQLHQSDYADEGVPLIMPKDILNFRISLESIARIPEDLADRLGRHRMIDGDTVYGRRGDIGRRAYISKRQVGWFCGTGCMRLRPDPVVIDPRYLFDTLGAPETAGVIANRAKGSTMPNLSGSSLKSVPILVAPRRLQDQYSSHVVSITDQIETLAKQNTRLRAARDLLLRRLMSGAIAV